MENRCYWSSSYSRSSERDLLIQNSRFLVTPSNIRLMVEKLSWEASFDRRWRWCGCRIVESVSHLSLWKRCSFPMLASRQEPHATSKGRVLDSPLPARCLRRKGGASGLKAAWGKVHAFTSLSHLRT